MPRKPCRTDVSDEEWSFAAPYLTLMDRRAPARARSAGSLNALRWLVRSGAPWRMLPNYLPPWWAVFMFEPELSPIINATYPLISQDLSCHNLRKADESKDSLLRIQQNNHM